MKAIIQFFSTGSGTATLSASKVIEGKDLRIHVDGPSAYHLTDAYHNHKLIGAYSGVESIELEGKPKQRKPKPAETLTIEVDTSKLKMCIKEAMLELIDALKSPLPTPRLMPDVPHAYRDAPSALAKLPDCTCQPKRKIDTLGHLSYCPNSPYYNEEEGELPQPSNE